MSMSHVRVRLYRLAALCVALAAVLGLLIAGSASARTNRDAGTTFATTTPVPGLNAGESARFTIVDDGRSIVILGRGRNLGGARDYISLIYTDAACSVPETPSGLTVNGAWQNRGDRWQTLYARYDGDAYRAVRGKIGSVSIRQVTAATNAGDGTFTLTAAARACATLNPRR